MAYRVKEIFYSIQGEGIQAGRPAVFCRFSGCNLWSGREEDRSDSVCKECDTDFVGTDGDGGGAFAEARDLAEAVVAKWPDAEAPPFVVCTGGEPLLQLDEALLEALHQCRCYVAIETNGTLRAPAGIDWLCVSPKAGSEAILRSGDELKLLYRQGGLGPDDVAGWEFEHFLLQPIDGPEKEKHTQEALAYCMAHPQWRLSVQLHKVLGVQ